MKLFSRFFLKPQQQQQQQQQMKPAQQQHQLQQQQQQNYPAAPEKPARAFDLFFKHQMDSHSGETNFDRQSYAEQCRYFTYTFENVSFKSL